MRSVRSLIVLLGVIAPGAAAQERTPATPTPDGSTAIEQALIEHACRSQLPGIAGADAYQECLSARLRSLRADFGRDLSQVSAADRKALDAACSNTRQAEGREAYLECLTVQLDSIRNRGSNANPAASQAPPLSSSPENLRSASLAIPESATSFSSRVLLWIGVAIVAVVVAGGGALMALKGRRATRICRVCGADVPAAGDLCPKCRHEAAEALRSAAAERADHERAQAAEQQRQSEREDELRRRRAREEENARLRQEEDGRQRKEESARREQEEKESRQRSQPAVVEAESVSDPYAVLGVPRDAGQAAIDAAWQEARLKYAPE